ncbi:NADH:ubiquinone reductase (Na(+)-transporting) subunit C [Sinomicrobium weinanense]|uniref:Na(+)-translocating NADH-quinone reductase subunit C n=1 Tax=Sinomicrobium weinanense TaxID=2842200 RepID=A0A926JWR5_9FLAO|nr:NADH:ubiquinone reductase (Na(+)-transporting) subunit C [Sinomicrobium weinanense]MBC9798576.1 NADH:ubiquinone reductase (Na(+)-transporting) subunit C [Sinomicrobium weinanense]MBU3121919.1 NADH:ubiquinone reductase (Na(+)-transporting) subunit C [Sinomicrobium weinanense]
MNREGNLYTFIFAIVMVVIVAFSLAFAATSLKPKQSENVKKEKMQNILGTIGIEVEREAAEEKYKNYIKEELSLVSDGSVDEQSVAFDVDLNKELKLPEDKQHYPLYIAEVEGKKYYVVPLRGAGLWNAIWGYIALEDDLNTIKGVSFDHAGETPGLGAEITQAWFQDSFKGKKIFDGQDELVGITVSKGSGTKGDNEVDAISGATITGDGVTDMVKERLLHYLPYFKKEKTQLALN